MSCTDAMKDVNNALYENDGNEHTVTLSYGRWPPPPIPPPLPHRTDRFVLPGRCVHELRTMEPQPYSRPRSHPAPPRRGVQRSASARAKGDFVGRFGRPRLHRGLGRVRKAGITPRWLPAQPQAEEWWRPGHRGCEAGRRRDLDGAHSEAAKLH